MPLRENELARRDPAGLLLRSDPLAVKWEFGDLKTADGHQLHCQFKANVLALPDRTEQLALQEVLLDGRRAVFAEDVAEHFRAALHSAAARVAQAHDAKDWIDGDIPRQSLGAAIKAAAVPVAFACGLEVGPLLELEVQSPTFERKRIRSRQQAMIEKEAAANVDQASRVAELLKQFQAFRVESPELSAGQILAKIDTADRGPLMQVLLLAGARQSTTDALWAVAGPYLVRVEADRPLDPRTPPKVQLFALPPVLGPLRSVQSEIIDGRQMLMVGAQSGFFLVCATDCNDARAFRDSGFESALGFNRVIYWPQRKQYCATHSERGIVFWNAEQPDSPTHVLRPAALGIFPGSATPDLSLMTASSLSIRGGSGVAGPRNVRLLNSDAVIFSAGNRVMICDGKSAKTVADANESDVVGIVSDDNLTKVLYEDGTICAVDANGGIASERRQLGAIRAAAWMPWLGTTRLLLATDDGPMQCVGFDDSIITHYTSSHKGLRIIAGSAAMVAAVSPDRQRILLWNCWDGHQPATELFIGAQTRHRIADVVFSVG